MQTIEQHTQERVNAYNAKLAEFKERITLQLAKGRVWESENTGYGFSGECAIWNVVNIAAWYQEELKLQSIINECMTLEQSAENVKIMVSEFIAVCVAEEECDAFFDKESLV